MRRKPIGYQVSETESVPTSDGELERREDLHRFPNALRAAHVGLPNIVDIREVEISSGPVCVWSDRDASR